MKKVQHKRIVVKIYIRGRMYSIKFNLKTELASAMADGNVGETRSKFGR